MLAHKLHREYLSTRKSLGIMRFQHARTDYLTREIAEVKIGNACLDGAFDSPEEQSRRMTQTLANHNVYFDQYDTLVGTGFSGALVVPQLGRALAKDYLLIRKPGDSHHHGTAIAEGNFNNSGKWIFVDDGIATGATYSRVRKAVNQLAISGGVPDLFHGAYLYGHGEMYPAAFWTPDQIYRNGIRI